MKEKEKKTNPIKKSILPKILIVIGAIIGVLLLGIIALYIYAAVGSKKLDLKYDKLKNDIENHNIPLHYDTENNIVENFKYIEYNNIPKDLINAVISAEQPHYFSNDNYDFKRIINPTILLSKENAYDTIPLTLLKSNMNLDIGYNYSYFENLKLAYFSSHVFEKDFTKEGILEYYLNSQYLGGQSYGIEEASKYYFGKSVSNLSLPESAMIAGLFQLPGKYNPYKFIEGAETRKDLVIRLMYRYGYITKEEYDNALNIKIESLLADNPNAQVIDIQEYVSLDKTENDYKNYSINLKKAYEDNRLFDSLALDENKIVLKYKIGNYDITLKLQDSTKQQFPIYDAYVNGIYVYNDYALWHPQITLFHDYIILKDNGTTNIRSLHLYIVDNAGNINELYELDPSNSGMRGNEFNIADDKLSIKGYRMTHGGSIVYNKHAEDGYYSLVNKNGCNHALNELSDDFLIEAVYSYKYENGTLNMTPELSEKVTLKDYIEKHNLCK